MKNLETFPRMHVSYYVSDLSKTIDFYTKFFEVEPVKIKESYAKFILTAPSLNISFIENPDSLIAICIDLCAPSPSGCGEVK